MVGRSSLRSRLSFVSGQHVWADGYRWRRVLATRCILPPQKQVGSARLGAGPIIRKRICAPQDLFGHSHHSSRLFFTNGPPLVSTRRADAPIRCVRPHDAGLHSRPWVACRPKWFIGHNLAPGYQPSPEKDVHRSRLRPLRPRLVFIPSSTIARQQTHSWPHTMSNTEFDEIAASITFVAEPGI